jgi:hypothetical protein
MDADADKDFLVGARVLVDAGENPLRAHGGLHGIHRASEIHQVGIPDVLHLDALMPLDGPVMTSLCFCMRRMPRLSLAFILFVKSLMSVNMMAASLRVWGLWRYVLIDVTVRRGEGNHGPANAQVTTAGATELSRLA